MDNKLVKDELWYNIFYYLSTMRGYIDSSFKEGYSDRVNIETIISNYIYFDNDEIDE